MLKRLCKLECAGESLTFILQSVVAALAFVCLSQCDLPGATYWTGGGATTSAVDPANWDNGVPSNSNPGIVNAGGTVTYADRYDLNGKTITFNGNATLSGGELRPGSSIFVFNDTSQLLLGGLDLKLWGNTTVNLNDAASMSVRGFVCYNSGNNTVNHNDSVHIIAARSINWDQNSGNVYNLSAGKISASAAYGGFIITAGNYFNFPAGSTGVMEVRGADHTSVLQEYVTGGMIRYNGAQVSLGYFEVTYAGGNTTLKVNTAGNNPPVVEDVAFSVFEGGPLGTVVGTVSASDADNDTLSFSIVDGNTGNTFVIDSATGEIMVVNPLNYDLMKQYMLTVMVLDDHTPPGSDTAVITINVQGNSAPVANDASFQINEDAAIGTAVGVVVASDPDAGDTLSYAITGGNTDNTFAIDSGNGQITVAGILDYETKNYYVLTVTVTDDGNPQKSDTRAITITLNPAPITGATYWTTGASGGSIIDPTNWSNGVPTNTAPGVLLAGDNASAPNRDDLNNKTLILFGNAQLNGGERLSNSTLTLNDSSSWTSSKRILPFGGSNTINFNGPAVTVNLTNSLAFYLGTTIVNHRGGEVYIGEITDVHGSYNLSGGRLKTNDSSIPINFLLGGTGALSTEVAGETLMGLPPVPSYPYGYNNQDFVYWTLKSFWDAGKLLVNNQYADERGLTFEDVFQYTCGTGIQLSSNRMPAIVEDIFTVVDGSVPGTGVCFVDVHDHDALDSFTYAISSGNTGAAFAINSATGQITVAGTIDRSTTATYTLTIQVTDSGGLTGSGPIAIVVTPAAEIVMQFTGTGGDALWNNADNWTNGVPTYGCRAVLDGALAAEVNTTEDLSSINFTGSSAGDSLLRVVSGGKLDLFGGITMCGSGGATYAELEVAGGSVTTGSQVTASDSGTGTIWLHGAGTLSCPSMSMQAGSVTGDVSVLKIEAGNVNVTEELCLGETAGLEGKIIMQEGALNCGSLTLGRSGSGTLVQYGGTITVDGALHLGQVSGSHCTLALYGGALDIGDIQNVSNDGSEVIHLGGGVLRFSSAGSAAAVLKNLVDSGRVTWAAAPQGSEPGSGTVLYSWVNSQGVTLYLSSDSLWTQEVITTGLESYLEYFRQKGLTRPTETDPSINPDGDQLTNLMEYGFGGDPTVADDGGLIPVYRVIWERGQRWAEVTFRRRVHARDAGVEYVLKTTDDPASGVWQSVPDWAVEPVSAAFERVTSRTAMTGSNVFYKLELVLTNNHYGDRPSTSELIIDTNGIYDASMPVGEARPQGNVDVASPWFHIQVDQAGPYSFRLSQDPSFQTGVIQSGAQKWKFWNPWQDLSVGTWYWTYGTGNPGSITWHPKIFSFEITGTERTIPLPPTPDAMLALIKAKSFPFLHCDAGQVGRLLPTSADPVNSSLIINNAIDAYNGLSTLPFAALNPANYLTRAEFETAVETAATNYLSLLKRLTRGYFIIGQTYNAYAFRSRALQRSIDLKQEYDVRQWTYNWGSGSETVRLSDLHDPFVSLNALDTWCAVLDAFYGNLDQPTITLYADLALEAYCISEWARSSAYLADRTLAPTYLFDRFEHVYYDQHWQQIYIWFPMHYIPFLCRFHPDLDEWVKYTYNLYLYRCPMGSRDDGAWVEDNAYFGANEWTLTTPPVFYSRMTNYSYNFFGYKPWFQNVSKYLFFTTQNGEVGNGFGDGVGASPAAGTTLPSLMECLWTLNKTDPYATYHLYRIYDGSSTPERYKMEERLMNWQQQGFTHFAQLSMMEHYGAWAVSGTPTPAAELGASFRDQGYAAMHTDHANTQNDLYVNFHANPYGAQMHAHPSQNAFNIGYGGKDLFWHTGFYNTGPGPWHDRLDYKSSRGHNTIMADGITQVFDSPKGYGWLPRFVHGDKISYALGDATNAYPKDGQDYAFAGGSPRVKELGYGYPKVKRFRRHIALLRPSHVVIYDELEAKDPIPWTFMLHTRTTENMTKRGEGWITAYNHISDSPSVYGIGNFKLFCKEPFTTQVSDHFFGAHPNNSNSKYGPAYDVSGMPTAYHAYLTSTVSRDKLRFLAVIAVSKSSSSSTVPAELSGSTDVDGLFSVQLGSYTVKAQLDSTQPAYLEARNNDETAALVTGQAAETITLNGVTNAATLKGNTLLMERNTYRGNIFIEEKDQYPDFFKFSNQKDKAATAAIQVDMGLAPIGCTDADLDGYGLINLSDFALFMADWQDSGAGLHGDIDRNGLVDSADLAHMVSYWLMDCN